MKLKQEGKHLMNIYKDLILKYEMLIFGKRIQKLNKESIFYKILT